jgi:hypothetical protein
MALARRGELQRKAQPRMLPPPLGDQRPVRVVEEERPLQLRSGRHTIKAAVGGRLLIGKELDGHSPHNLWPATTTPSERGETVTFRAGRVGVRWNGQSR